MSKNDTMEKPIEPPVYSESEKLYYNNIVKRLCNMRDNRDQAHAELDGMTYIQYYDSNRKKDLSYIPPKKNKQDIRVVTGTTREKDTTLLSTMLDLNLEPDITAFDRDDIIVNELGDNVSDLVKKSREIEDWARFRPIIYRELISQGDVFVEEIYEKRWEKLPTNPIKWNPEKDEVKDLDYKTKFNKQEKCRAKMITGKKVYLGDIRTEYMADQLQAATAEIISRGEAESIYGKWARWKHVPKTVETTNSELLTDGPTYKTWNITKLNTEDQVCIIKFYDKENNNFQIMLNGVMMLPCNYPLTAINPTGEISITQGKLEPISDFAYSKSQPSKTKVDQEILDEITKLMVEAFRQGRKPPMGQKGKKVFSKSMFMPGEITNDVNKDTLFPLIQNNGISSGEFGFYNLIKESIDNKTQNATYSGEQQKGDVTATQILKEEKQQMLKLGAAIDGVMNLERQMTWHRIPNILVNWTKAVSSEMAETKDGVKKLVNKYKDYSVATTLENGEKGYKMFRMRDSDEFPDVADQEQEEYDLSRKYGRAVRIVYLSPKELRTLRWFWYININPTPKSNDQLGQLIFVQNIRTAVELFGPDQINQEYLKQRFAVLINEDYNKFFKKMDLMSMVANNLKPSEAMSDSPKRPTATQASGKQPLKPVIQ